MKQKIARITFIVIICLLGVIGALATTVYTNPSTAKSIDGRVAEVKCLSVVETIPHDGTTTTGQYVMTDEIHGFLYRVVLAETFDTTVGDTAFTMSVTDNHGIVLFTKTDCDCNAMPYSYAMTEAASDANLFYPVPVAGPLTFDVSAVGANTLTSVSWYLYYTENPR